MPPELAFFNSLSGKLNIELTVPPERIGQLDNVRALPDAKIKSLSLTAEVFERESKTFRDLTEQELAGVAYPHPKILLRGEGGDPVQHSAPNGQFFTVQQLLDAVAETERQTREQSDWFDGIDVIHIFFEGIYPDEEGVWAIAWGS